MAKGQTFNYGEPEWKRDESEYKELNKIENRIYSYNRLIQGGINSDGQRITLRQLLSYIKAYSSEVKNYLKWLSPYMKKIETQKRKGKTIHEDAQKTRLLIEALIERSEILYSEGIKKIKHLSTYLPKNFDLAFNYLEDAENLCRDIKVKFGMGVRSYEYMSEKEGEEYALDNTMGFKG